MHFTEMESQGSLGTERTRGRVAGRGLAQVVHDWCMARRD